jgi:thioredoxin reductase (NADPH)
VENFPGFPTGIGGNKLVMDTMMQVKNLGGEIKYGNVKEITKEQIPLGSAASPFDKGDFRIVLDDGTVLKSRTVIVATGAKARWLGIPREMELMGKGVSGCATCDGIFFRDKVVAVVGGGDTACEESVFLSKFTAKVISIHRRDQYRATEVEQKKVLNNAKIETWWNSEVKEIVGEERLTAIKVWNNKTNEEKIVPIDGLFVAVGHDPATGFLQGIAELKETGHIVVGKNPDFLMMTTMEGIFAAGDCVDDKYRQAIVAAGDGCRASLDAERWLEDGC